MAYATLFTNPGTLADQRFFYTCLGTEGDSFAIPLPALRADTNYVATVTLASTSNVSQYLINTPQVGRTTAGFAVITGSPVTAGDVLACVVSEVQ